MSSAAEQGPRIDRRRLFGVAAALTTIAVWVSWILATRLGVTTDLAALDLAFLRFAVAAALLSPIAFRTGLAPKGEPIGRLAVIVFGSGLGFVMLASIGMASAPPAAIGALLPSSLAIWTAALSFALFGLAPGRTRALGLACILAGILLGLAPLFLPSAGGDITGGVGLGAVLLPAASLAWASFTIAFGQSSLSPIQAAALSNLWSALLITPAWLAFGGGFQDVATGTLIFQIVQQGVFSGVVALFTWTYAVSTLGPSSAAAFAALTPAVAAVGGWAVLGEAPSAWGWAAAAAASIGVLLASGVLTRR